MNWPETWAEIATMVPDALVLREVSATSAFPAPAEELKLRLYPLPLALARGARTIRAASMVPARAMTHGLRGAVTPWAPWVRGMNLSKARYEHPGPPGAIMGEACVGGARS